MKNNFKNSPKILKPSKTYFTVIGGEELIIEGENLLPTDNSCDTSGLLKIKAIPFIYEHSTENF